MQVYLRFLTLSIFCLILTNCQKIPKENKLVLKKVTFKQLPGWSVDKVIEALPAFKASCEKILNESPNTELIVNIKYSDLQPACRVLLNNKISSDKAFRKFLTQWFIPYLATNNGKSKGFSTGYFIPIINGSRTKTKAFLTPVYSRPSDLLVIEDLGKFRPEPHFKNIRIAGIVEGGKLKPYFTRKEIIQGKLSNKGLEILWVDNPIDLFIMQIQGSGIAITSSGEKITLAYDGTNGHNYVAIGKFLKDKIKAEEMSMQAIRHWLITHPNEATEIMNQNPSYVFFRESKISEISGSHKSKLIPMRSIAIDTAFIPLGIPVWINIWSSNNRKKPLIQKLTVTQDTGGAIRGPIRADLFCGYGHNAGEFAGRLKHTTEFFLFLPKKTLH